MNMSATSDWEEGVSDAPAIRTHRPLFSNSLLTSALLSKGPRKLLSEVSAKTNELMRELSAVVVQRYVRGFLTRKAMKIRRLIGIIREQLSLSFAVTLIDEVVLANAQVVARQFIDDTAEQQAVDKDFLLSVNNEFAKLFEEFIPREVKLCVEQAVREEVEAYMDQKKKKEAQNPLLKLINHLIEESVVDGSRRVVVETINEAVDEHLLQVRCRIAFDCIVEEIVDKDLMESFDSLCVDVAEEIVCDDILFEVTDGIIHKEVNIFLESMRKELEEAHNMRERKAVSDGMKEVVVKRLLLAYLMSSISDSFATVQVELYCRKPPTCSYLILHSVQHRWNTLLVLKLSAWWRRDLFLSCKAHRIDSLVLSRYAYIHNTYYYVFFL